MLELNYYPPGSRFYEKFVTGSELDHLGFTVRDVEPVLARLRKVGVRRPVADFTEGGIRLTFVTDPDGIWIEFLSWVVPKQKLKAPLIDLALPNWRG
jgi:catechol 2,3-dioxygenase-like lactoylglutathione lyase family enzyme